MPAGLLLFQWSPISVLSPDPSDTKNALLTQLEPHCSGLHACRPGIYVVTDCVSCEDPNDRIRKLVYELASSIRGRTRQAVARALQDEEIWSQLSGGTREAQTRDGVHFKGESVVWSVGSNIGILMGPIVIHYLKVQNLVVELDFTSL